MKALILNQYYSSKTSILIYMALAIVFAILFTSVNNNSIGSAIFACMYPALGAMDYLKKESASGWLKYAITMPIRRRTIVNTHFLVHLLLVIVGFAISVITIALVKASFIDGVSSSFIGSGFTLQMALIYLLTYKFGSENSNGIYILAMLFIFIIFIIFTLTSAVMQNNDIALLSRVALNSYYLVFSIVIAFIAYYLSIKHFDKADF